MSKHLLDELCSISRDLHELLRESQEDHSSLFTSAAMAERYPLLPLAPPRSSQPVSKPKTAPTAPAKPRPQEPPLPPIKKEMIAPPSPPKSELPPQPVQEKEAPAAFFVLEPVPPPSPASSADQGQLTQKIRKLFPDWKLAERPPSDEEAVKIASSWKIRAATTEILVLLFSTNPRARTFVQNFTRALERLGRSAQMVEASRLEKENLWEAVLDAPRLLAVYAPPPEAWNAPHLKTYLKAIPATGQNFIGKCPLHFLQDPEIYMRSPEQKRLLWQQICERHLP